MGANVVIAVDIGSQLRPLDALASPADVMQQMVGILIRQNVTAQRKQLDTQDVLLTPDLGSLAFTDFQNAKQAIAAGAAAATAALPKLKRFALTPEQYAAYQSARTRSRCRRRSGSRASTSRLPAACRSRSSATRCT